MVLRLVTGCSWVTAERLLDNKVSDTTLRARRDEWIGAGVFGELEAEAIAAYDRIVGLDLSGVAIDGSRHKAPCGGEGTGRNPTGRGEPGVKWSLLADRAAIPVGAAPDGANRRDTVLLAPNLDAAARRGLLGDVEALHLDRGYDSGAVRRLCAQAGIDDVLCARRRRPGAATTKTPTPLGMRWAIERTNSWLSNFGQLRRNTDRRTQHRRAQHALAIALLLTAKLIDHRNRWDPAP